MTKFYIGADHGGFEFKERIKQYLSGQGYEVEDCGAAVLDPNDDYPPIAIAVAQKVAEESKNIVATELPAARQPGEPVGTQPVTDVRGILLCRSGAGMTIAANKVPGIRAATVHSIKEAEHARAHNNVNIVSLAADYLSEEEIFAVLKTFMETPFTEVERHQRRISQITNFENSLKDL